MTRELRKKSGALANTYTKKKRYWVGRYTDHWQERGGEVDKEKLEKWWGKVRKTLLWDMVAWRVARGKVVIKCLNS